MKKALLVLLAPVLLLQSCISDRVTGSGANGTEQRTVSNFTSIGTMGSTDVRVIKGTAFNVSVSGYKNLLPYLETYVDNNTLVVRFKNNTNVRNDNTEVTVTMPVLEGLYISGSADISTKGDFIGNDFQTRISGSGNISFEKGSTKNFTSQISGSGDVHATDFQAEHANIKISGSGNTHVSASSSLNVEIAGSGNVYYKGSPSLTVSVSGSGKVQKQ